MELTYMRTWKARSWFYDSIL